MPATRLNGVAVMADPLYRIDLTQESDMPLLEDKFLKQLMSDENQTPWFSRFISSLLGRVETGYVLPRFLGCYLVYTEVAAVAGNVSAGNSPAPVVSDDLFDTRSDDPPDLKRAAAIYVAAVRTDDQAVLESLQGVATAAITALAQPGAFIRPTDFAAFQAFKRLSELALKAMAVSVSADGS